MYRLNVQFRMCYFLQFVIKNFVMLFEQKSWRRTFSPKFFFISIFKFSNSLIRDKKSQILAAKVKPFEISSKFSTTILLRYILHPLRFYYVHFCNLLSIIDLNIEKNTPKIFLFQ